jgi:bis(5'-adenosyl)-triphosphatase
MLARANTEMNKVRMENCPFCAPDLQRLSFAESEDFIAIYNIAPILPGHSLVVPRWHVRSLMELSNSELGEMMVFARDAVKILLKTFGSEAFNWTIQEGDEAGQTVSHLHLHLIPREPNDLRHPGDWYPLLRKSEIEVIDSDERPRLEPEEIRTIVERIKSTAREMND